MNYNFEEKTEFQSRDQRISFLAIFRDLCAYFKDDKLPILGIAERAKAVVDWEFKQWPLVEIKDEPFGTKMPQRQPVGQKSKFCPVCGSPMIHQENLSHPKAPNWKCNDRKCKFSFNKETNQWEPGDYITGAWD